MTFTFVRLFFFPVASVIFLVSQDEVDVDNLGLIVDRNNQPVLIAANVEDRQIPIERRSAKGHADISKVLP